MKYLFISILGQKQNKKSKKQLSDDTKKEAVNFNITNEAIQSANKKLNLFPDTEESQQTSVNGGDVALKSVLKTKDKKSKKRSVSFAKLPALHSEEMKQPSSLPQFQDNKKCKKRKANETTPQIINKKIKMSSDDKLCTANNSEGGKSTSTSGKIEKSQKSNVKTKNKISKSNNNEEITMSKRDGANKSKKSANQVSKSPNNGTEMEGKLQPIIQSNDNKFTEGIKNNNKKSKHIPKDNTKENSIPSKVAEKKQSKTHKDSVKENEWNGQDAVAGTSGIQKDSSSTMQAPADNSDDEWSDFSDMEEGDRDLVNYKEDDKDDHTLDTNFHSDLKMFMADLDFDGERKKMKWNCAQEESLNSEEKESKNDNSTANADEENSDMELESSKKEDTDEEMSDAECNKQEDASLPALSSQKLLGSKQKCKLISFNTHNSLCH